MNGAAAVSLFHVIFFKFIYCKLYIYNLRFLSLTNEFYFAESIHDGCRKPTLRICYYTARPRFEQHCQCICLLTFDVDIIGKIETRRGIENCIDLKIVELRACSVLSLNFLVVYLFTSLLQSYFESQRTRLISTIYRS